MGTKIILTEEDYINQLLQITNGKKCEKTQEELRGVIKSITRQTFEVNEKIMQMESSFVVRI